MTEYIAPTPEQVAAAQMLVDRGVEYLDDDAPDAPSLVEHLRNVVPEFTPVGDWTDPFYAVILSR